MVERRLREKCSLDSRASSQVELGKLRGREKWARAQVDSENQNFPKKTGSPLISGPLFSPILNLSLIFHQFVKIMLLYACMYNVHMYVLMLTRA
jgi:hypothetical protein